MGHNDDGFRLLLRAYDDHKSNMASMGIDPEFEGKREPGYLTMLDRIGLRRTYPSGR